MVVEFEDGGAADEGAAEVVLLSPNIAASREEKGLSSLATDDDEADEDNNGDNDDEDEDDVESEEEGGTAGLAGGVGGGEGGPGMVKAVGVDLLSVVVTEEVGVDCANEVLVMDIDVSA